MLGYMNEEALILTRESGFVTFYSRSRQRLWRKGETSGHTLRVVELRQDCDGDALLILAEPAGPTCHTGRPSCFFRDLDGSEMVNPVPPVAILTRLADRIRARRDTDPTESYTAKLLHGGVDRIGKKIGEEAAEVIIAAKNGDPAEVAYELADLIYHSLVLLENQGMSAEAVWAELARRYTSS
ncbi:MAG: histidine biosynthesis bifunctional protein HisIE [Chloroflexus sp.]|nr:MAG: histidine biosynthesis bifunctional protein HisIE [Chloroflexus sp.]